MYERLMVAVLPGKAAYEWLEQITGSRRCRSARRVVSSPMLSQCRRRHLSDVDATKVSRCSAIARTLYLLATKKLPGEHGQRYRITFPREYSVSVTNEL